MPGELSRITAIDAGASADIGAVADAAVTDPTASASLIAASKGILKQLQGDGSGAADVKITDIEAITTIAGQKAMAASLPVVLANDHSDVKITLDSEEVDISNDATRELGKVSIDDGDNAAQGTTTDAAVTDPTAAASMIAALKGIIKQLQGNGSGAVPISIGGVAPGLDNTNELKASLYGKNAAAGDTPVLVDASGNVQVSLATALSSATDSIDVAKMSKGSVTTAHSAITETATSNEIDCRGFKGAHIEFAITGTGNWDLEVTGCAVSGGTFTSQYVGKTRLLRQGMTANAGYILPIGANYIKIVATENSGTATVTVKVTPVNLSPAMETAIVTQLRQTQIGADLSNTWAASAVQYTNKDDTVTQPTTPIGTYEVTGKNTSLITAVTVYLENVKSSLGGETCYAEVAQISLPATTGAVIEDCEDAWDTRQGANVTCDVDAVNYKVGTNSADFVVGADATTGLLATEAISSTNLSRYTHIRAWVLVTGVALDAGDLQFCVDDTANCASPLETINLPAIADGVWTRVDLPLANPESDLAIISVGISMAVDKGAFTLNLDDVQAIKMSVTSTLVSGLFNGGNVRIKQRNETALGANDAFTSTIRIEEYL